VELRVAGIASEFAAGGQVVYLEWGAARRLLDIPGAHAFLVRVRPQHIEPARQALQRFCGQRRLLLQSNAELREVIDRLLSRVTAALWGLIALTFVVASLGVINTLTLNVSDQAREFALLRALGLRTRQVCRVVLVQAFLLCGVILPAGGAAGIALAYAIHRTSSYWAGPPAAFHVDATLTAGCCALALVLTVGAGLLPARRAARRPVIEFSRHG
jgi:putative ABC transport system permease protein